MATIIKGPKNGSTTYKFNNKRNQVIVKRSSLDYQLVLKGNNDIGIGSNGNDLIDGGTGFDKLQGGNGNDELLAGATTAGKRDQNQLLGDQELIKVSQFGGEDQLIGGGGCVDQLIGDAANLYGTGGRDRLQAAGWNSEMIGDAIKMQASSKGGNDILTGASLAGSRTSMYGDAISVYGPARCGNDDLISGRSDDYMYGDYQFAFPAPFADDPYIFDIYDQYGFFTPPTEGLQPFVYLPIIYDLSNQDPSSFDPSNVPANSQVFTLEVPVLVEKEVVDPATGESRVIYVASEETTTESWVIPDRTVDNLAPVGGADRFIFRTLDEGNDVIFDFNTSEGDLIVFTNGLSLEDQGSGFQILENGRDTLIRYGTSSILLPYVQGLTSSAFQFGDQFQPINSDNFSPVVLA